MSAGTIDTRNFAEAFDDHGRRIALVEQQLSNPDLTIGAGGDGDNSFEEIIIENPGVGSDATIRFVADPPTGLGATTSAFLEEIYIDISWTPGETNTPQYEVEVAKQVSPGVYEAPRLFVTSGTSTRVVVGEANTVYGVRVASINRAGIRSAFTSYLDVTTAIDSTVPPAVSGLSVFAGLNSIVVEFDRLTPVQAPDMQNGRGLYRIQLSDDNFVGVDQEKYTSANIEAFEGVTQGTNYKIRVAPIDSSGNQGPWTTSADVAPGYVTDSVIQPGTITGNRIIAGTVAADRIVAASITTAQIQAGGINGDRITANTLNANRITTSSLTSADITLAGGSLIANNPVSGTGVLINSQGVRVYKASVLAVNLDATTGNVLVNGDIRADQFTLLRTGVEVGRLQGYSSDTIWSATSASIDLDHGAQNSFIRWDVGKSIGSGVVAIQGIASDSTPWIGATGSGITASSARLQVETKGTGTSPDWTKTYIARISMVFDQPGGQLPYLYMQHSNTVRQVGIGAGNGMGSLILGSNPGGTNTTDTTLNASSGTLHLWGNGGIEMVSFNGALLEGNNTSSAALRIRGATNEKIRLQGSSGNNYISFFNAAGTSRLGFIQHDGTSFIMANDTGSQNLFSGGVRGYRPTQTSYINAQFIAQNTSGSGSAALALWNGSQAPQWESSTSVGEVLRAVNSAVSAYVPVWGGAYTNASSKRWKKDVKTWRTKSLSAAAERPIDKVNRLRVVTYKSINNAVDRIPGPGEGFDRSDGSFDDKRRTAIARLNKVHALASREQIVVKHICGVDCSGSTDQPCGPYINATKDHIGLIAEETFDVVPEAVTLDQNGNPLGLDVLQVAVLALAGEQDLAAENRAFREHVAILEERITTLENRIAS